MKIPSLLLLLALAPLTAVAAAAQGAPSPESAAAESSVLFDGASRYATAASPQATPEDKAQLLAELKKHVAMDDHGVPAERDAMDSMLARMMDSPTARELAVKFIKEDAKVKFTLEDMPGSTVVTVDGKKAVWGTRGFSSIDKAPPTVVLNKLFMQPDVDTGAGTLAHEMLGHTFEKQRTSGDLDGVYQYNNDEEENARLIGWLVEAELNLKPDDETWAYMQDPDANTEYIKMMAPCYALTLTSEEMKDPVPVYTRRLADADKVAQNAVRNAKFRSNWTLIIGHFVGVSHKMDPAAFEARKEDIATGDKYFPIAQDNIKKIKEALQERITYFSSDEGKQFLAKLAKEADSDYFQKKDAQIMERREKLSGLMLGKTPDSFRAPPAVGQITWDQLVGIWEKDKNLPCASGVLK